MQHIIISNNEVKMVMEPRILKVGEKVSGRYRDIDSDSDRKFPESHTRLLPMASCLMRFRRDSPSALSST